MDYTIEIYKVDKRRKSGDKLFTTISLTNRTFDYVEGYAEGLVSTRDDLRFIIHETWREVRNVMSGKVVKEHYDTPYYLSVSSEAYWSN